MLRACSRRDTACGDMDDLHSYMSQVQICSSISLGFSIVSLAK